jgi:hypothetical protein
MQRITIGSHELKRTHIIDIGPQSRSHAIKEAQTFFTPELLL